MTRRTPPETARGERREAFYSDVRERAAQNPLADPSATELLVHLFNTSDLVEARSARYLSRFNLSIAAYNVLMILRHSEGMALPLHEVSALLLVSRANVTGLVDNLEQRGLVERRPDAHDRRVRIVHLVEAGLALTHAVEPDHLALMRRVCADVTEEERQTLVRLLGRLRASAEKAEETPR